jgi:hypothetical protein
VSANEKNRRARAVNSCVGTLIFSSFFFIAFSSEFFFLFIHPFSLFLWLSVLLPFRLFRFVFIALSFPPFFSPLFCLCFSACVVSSLAYPNLSGTKKLGYCCCWCYGI